MGTNRIQALSESWHYARKSLPNELFTASHKIGTISALDYQENFQG